LGRLLERGHPHSSRVSYQNSPGVERMTQVKSLSRNEVLALRGLRLPSVALNSLQRVGIYCQPAISIEFQQAAQRYLIRGVESGGAVAQVGAYCGFMDGAGSPLQELHPVKMVGVNGLHGVVLSPSLVRVQMFRAGTIYELLITSHALVQLEGKGRPTLQSSILFHGKHGTLEMELWGRDLQLRGMVIPVFYNRSGAQTTFPDRFHDAILRVTVGACCVGCRHRHLLNSEAPLTHWR
jgi:hypothetical protein